MIAAEERTMENKRKLMQFFFIRQEESSVHYHQDLEIIYVMKGKMERYVPTMVQDNWEAKFPIPYTK